MLSPGGLQFDAGFLAQYHMILEYFEVTPGLPGKGHTFQMLYYDRSQPTVGSAVGSVTTDRLGFASSIQCAINNSLVGGVSNSGHVPVDSSVSFAARTGCERRERRHNDVARSSADDRSVECCIDWPMLGNVNQTHLRATAFLADRRNQFVDNQVRRRGPAERARAP